FAPDDRWLATGSGDGSLKLWEVATGKEVKTLGNHKGGVLALAWGAEGKMLISGGADGTVKLWDTDADSKTFGTELASVQAHDKEVTCLGLAHDGKRLASGGADGTVKIWSLANPVLDLAGPGPGVAAFGAAGMHHVAGNDTAVVTIKT